VLPEDLDAFCEVCHVGLVVWVASYCIFSIVYNV
jgi:hypothetical protein